MTPADNRERNLDALLAAAGAPAYPEEHDELALDVVLTAFNAAGTADASDDGYAASTAAGERVARNPRSARNERPAWTGRRGSLVLVRSAALIVIAIGSGVAAAAAGILPVPVQSMAHHVLGGIGVPAPSDSGGGSTPSSPVSASRSATQGPHTTATPSGSASTGSGGGIFQTPSAEESASLQGLCVQVLLSGSSWKQDLSGQDVALLIATAGKEKKVVGYCQNLLAPDQQATTTPAPSATASNGQGDGNGNGDGKPTATAAPAPSASPTDNLTFTRGPRGPVPTPSPSQSPSPTSGSGG